jgi:hypothetical protein
MSHVASIIAAAVSAVAAAGLAVAVVDRYGHRIVPIVFMVVGVVILSGILAG